MSPARTDGPHFEKKGLDVLAALAKNNRREWFLAHKDEFEQHVKAPMVALVEALNGVLKTAAPEFATEPKKALMRMNRDVRFSKDKSPYRTDISARFGHGGGKSAEAGGYYLSVSPRGVDVAGGAHTLEPPQLAALRRRIAKAPDEFRAVTTDRGLRAALGEIQGERLVRVPKDFPPDHPAGDLLRWKQVYAYTTLPASLATSPTLFDEVARRFRAATPLVKYLTSATGG